MKTTLYISALLLILTTACQKETDKRTTDEIIETGNVDEMKIRRDLVLSAYDSVGQLLGKLEAAISEKDTLKRLPLVTYYKVKDTLFEHYIAVQGDVDTKQNLIIYPEFAGTLTRVYVNEGDNVNAGQLLARIDDGGLSDQLRQLETQYQLALTTFERQERLWKQKIGSEIQYLQAKANKESLENTVRQTRAQLAKTTVRAPFSGTIDEVITEQGQVVNAGMHELMRIVNLKNMYVKASIPENYVQSIHKGSAVMVRFPAFGKEIQGTVRQVGNFINPNNRTFEIEVDVPNEEGMIKPNLIAKLEINNYHNPKARIIPDNVIQENSTGEKFVYALTEMQEDEARVVKTKIETGLNYKGYIEVLTGLDKGLLIVKDGAIALRDGLKVKVQNPGSQNE